MKFAVAVVMFVCAVAGVQSSILPLTAQIAPGVLSVNSVAHGGLWGGSPWAGAPWAGAPWGGAWGGPAAVAVHAGAAPWGLTAPGLPIPGISLAQGPVGAAIAPRLLGHEGVYVAKTRGAIHTAPLAGHINSATSINVAPAPGTL